MIEEPFVVTNLREVYHEIGDFEYKLVLDTDVFGNNCDPKISSRDSSGNTIKSDVRIWGSKLKCMIQISEKNSDGVAVSTVSLKSKDGKEHQKTVTFWVIK